MRRQASGSTQYRIGCASVGAVLLAGSLVVAASGDPSAREIQLYHDIDSLPRAVDALLSPASAVGGWLLPVLILSTVAVWLRSIRVVADGVASGLLAVLVAEALKRIVERGRPCAFLDQPPCSDPGFPSTTTAVTFAVAAVVAGRLPRRLTVLAFTLASAVGVGRVLVGEHLPADVVGGAGTGLLVGAFVLAVGR